jgi:hypothetical protein
LKYSGRPNITFNNKQQIGKKMQKRFATSRYSKPAVTTKYNSNRANNTQTYQQPQRSFSYPLHERIFFTVKKIYEAHSDDPLLWKLANYLKKLKDNEEIEEYTVRTVCREIYNSKTGVIFYDTNDVKLHIVFKIGNKTYNTTMKHKIDFRKMPANKELE